MYLASVLFAMGDLHGAAEAIEKAKHVAQGLSPWFDAIVSAHAARLHLARGEIAAASRWAEANKAALTGPLELSYFSTYLVLAQALVALGRMDEALGFLARLIKVAEAAGAGWHVVRLLVLQAAGLQAQGRREAAREALSRALKLGEPEALVRSFVDGGETIRLLISELGLRMTDIKLCAYADKLLAAFGADSSSHQPPTEIKNPQSEIVEPLSERELQVLRLLGQDLSSTEIADALIISANTVRSHIKSIYGKLDVHDRTAALDLAHELGLL
jgi:LuxR family maltose regulon positive regulatory protein